MDLAAGNDLTLQAATVAGTGDVALVAGNDISIETAQNTVTESHSSHTKKSGLFGTGGIGFTIGKQTRENTANISEQTHTGSLIGSTDGRVDIVAGGDVAIAGSDVLSKAGIGITGENVAITAVENSLSVVEAQKFRQAGLNVSLKGGVVDTAMTVYGATQRGSEVEDDRLKALYAAQAGQTLFSDGQAGVNSLATAGDQVGALAGTSQKTQASGNSGLSLRIGIGASKSDSEQTYTETTAHGSRIASEGDVAIVARTGDVTVTGSQIEGDNVALAAARDLILQSSQESSEMRARDQSSSGEIGITIGTEAGIGVYVSAHAAKGAGDGGGNTHAETVVTAGDTLTLTSGRDTTLEGAQAIGDTVIANVGRNLTLTSQQDSNDYEREDKSGGIDVAVGMGGGSASGYYNQSDIDSTYTSVREQTGIQAGAGGFDIQVGGHTELTGAAIASTADAELNRLSTETLSATDLHNEAAYDASSFGVSGGASGVKDQKWSGSASPSLAVSQSESANSTTRSWISAGTLEIRDGDDTALASLDRELTELQQSGLGEIFDEQKVAERMEMGQVAGQVGMRAVGDLADKMRNDALDELRNAQSNGDPAALDAAVTRVNAWTDGGTGKALLHGVAGAAIAALGGGDALSGALGAGGVEKAKQAMTIYLLEQDIEFGSSEFDLLMELGSVALGSTLGGSSGAATALLGDQYNRQLHPDEIAWLSAQAAVFAAQLHGCDPSVCTESQVREAKQRLIVEAAARVDAVIADRVDGVDAAAQSFINNHPVTFAWGEGFTATRDQYLDFTYFAGLLSDDTHAFTDLAVALGNAGWTKRDVQNAYYDQLLALADATRAANGVAMIETFTGEVGMVLGIVRKLVQGDTSGAVTDAVWAALPLGIVKAVGKARQPMAAATEGTYWLNGKTINDAWVNPSGELTWLHPVTGAMEVIPDTARVHVDHVLPKNYILNKIQGFDRLPPGVQQQLLNSPENLQPMLASANCSKGCRVEWVDGGWKTWNGKPVSAAYKAYLERAQAEFGKKVEKAVDAHRKSGGG